MVVRISRSRGLALASVVAALVIAVAGTDQARVILTGGGAHHDSGQHEKAAHHAHTAAGHAVHAREHAEEARKAHTEEYGKK